jgi:hypothetical protein
VELKVMDFGKDDTPSREIDIVYVFYELEWPWSGMRWLVSPRRRVKAKKTSSVDADIEGTKLEIGSNSLFRRETLQEVSLTSEATMNGNSPLSGCKGASFTCQSHSLAL